MTNLDCAGVLAPLGVDAGPDAEEVRDGAHRVAAGLRVSFPLRSLLSLSS